MTDEMLDTGMPASQEDISPTLAQETAAGELAAQAHAPVAEHLPSEAEAMQEGVPARRRRSRRKSAIGDEDAQDQENPRPRKRTVRKPARPHATRQAIPAEAVETESPTPVAEAAQPAAMQDTVQPDMADMTAELSLPPLPAAGADAASGDLLTDVPHASAETDASTGEEAVQPEKPARRSRARRKKAAVENAPEQQEAQSVPSIAIATEAELFQAGMEEEAAARDEEGSEADAGEAEAEMPRKSKRGRRGGRSRRRRGKTAQQVGEQLDVVPLEGIEEEPADENPEEEAPARPAVRGRRRMFVSVLPSEQVEVAIVEDGVVQEYYLEMQHQAKIKGNIYKGVIHNIDTNLQAAFVDYGTNKNGFLQIDEIHPEYFLAHHEPVKGKKYPPIQKVLRPGQEVLVQVVKEPNGSKGAFLTTWLSLAGRFLVLTPGQEQIGISRKVESDEERARLREMMAGIEPGEGLGVIVRTVSAGTSKTTLKNDLQYLKRVWKDIRKRGTSESAPCLIYQEPGLAERAVRDYLTEDMTEIWVDDAEVADSIRETASMLFPRKPDMVKVHTDSRQGMWERFNLQRQLEQIYAREVTLPSGGRLVFDQTEALLAIDINSGKISGKTNFEAMAHRTNMEAAEAIARQLKLRDIGGQIVIDFIEMRDKNHVRDVEKTLRVAMKSDRARHDVSRMSAFGLLEMVRQRTGSSALSITMEPCPHCGGTGLRRNLEWQALQALREIRRLLAAARDVRCVYPASVELGMYLLNNKRKTLQLMEQSCGKTIGITIRP